LKYNLRKQIQDILNQQTYLQFKAYAEQQYPDNRQAVRRNKIAIFCFFEKNFFVLARRINSTITRTTFSTIYGTSLSTTIN